ncbi:MAG: hypothetical protein V7L14_31180, partial [Nostoc sp.]|uniref:hypothetical protein n=1 Tax=Nostoc sp. TaxID=1180 RepID=UPI002FF5E683
WERLPTAASPTPITMIIIFIVCIFYFLEVPKQKLLTFLVQVNRSQPNSHWDISRALHLGPIFGLYRLEDADEQYHACAFNQDALLLEALKWRIPRCDRTKPYIF